MCHVPCAMCHIHIGTCFAAVNNVLEYLPIFAKEKEKEKSVASRGNDNAFYFLLNFILFKGHLAGDMGPQQRAVCLASRKEFTAKGAQPNSHCVHWNMSNKIK